MPLQAVATFVPVSITSRYRAGGVSMPLQAVATFVFLGNKRKHFPKSLNAFAGSSYFC